MGETLWQSEVHIVADEEVGAAAMNRIPLDVMEGFAAKWLENPADTIMRLIFADLLQDYEVEGHELCRSILESEGHWVTSWERHGASHIVYVLYWIGVPQGEEGHNQVLVGPLPSGYSGHQCCNSSGTAYASLLHSTSVKHFFDGKCYCDACYNRGIHKLIQFHDD